MAISSFLKTFPNLGKALGTESLGQYSTRLVQTPSLRPFFQALDENVGMFGGVDNLSPQSLSNLRDASSAGINKSLRDFYSTGREAYLKENFETFRKQNLGQNMSGKIVKNYVGERLESVAQTSKELYGSFVSRLEGNIVERGGNLPLKMFRDFYSNSQKASELYGIKDIDIFKALKNPEAQTDEALKVLGTSYRELDKELIGTIQNLNRIGDIEDYVVPLQPNAFVVQSLGVEDLSAIILKYANNVEDSGEALKIAKHVYAQAVSETSDSGNLFFGSRKLTFDTPEDEFNYFKAITGFGEEGDESLLNAMLRHKENLINKAYLFKELGGSPEKAIKKLFSEQANLARKDGNIKLLSELEEAQKGTLKTLQILSGKGLADSDTLQYIASGIEKIVSGSFGAPKSSLRNVGIDFSAHGMSFAKALLTKETVPEYFFSRVFNLNKAMFSRPLNKELRTDLNKVLDEFEFSNSTSALFNQVGLQGILTRNAMTSPLRQSKGKQLAKSFDEIGGKFNRFMHTVAGNLFQYDTASLYNLIKMGKGFKSLLDANPDFKTFSSRIGGIGEGYLKTVFDIGEREFLALKQVQSATFKGSSIQKSLGFKDSVEVFLPKNIMKMSDEWANNFRRRGETPKQFKERLKASTYAYLTMGRNLSQTSLSSTNRFVARGLQKGTFVDILLRGLTPFFNIAEAQWQNLRKGLSLQYFGNPYRTGLGEAFTNKSMASGYMKSAVFYASGATGVTIARDVVNGRTPRELNANEMAKIFAMSGFGGASMSILSASLMGRRTGFYGATPLGDIMYRWNQALDFKDTAREETYDFAKALQNTTGVGKLWYSQAITDYIIREAILSKKEIKRMNQWYEKNLKSSIYLR